MKLPIVQRLDKDTGSALWSSELCCSFSFRLAEHPLTDLTTLGFMSVIAT